MRINGLYTTLNLQGGLLSEKKHFNYAVNPSFGQKKKDSFEHDKAKDNSGMSAEKSQAKGTAEETKTSVSSKTLDAVKPKGVKNKKTGSNASMKKEGNIKQPAKTVTENVKNEAKPIVEKEELLKDTAKAGVDEFETMLGNALIKIKQLDESLEEKFKKERVQIKYNKENPNVREDIIIRPKMYKSLRTISEEYYDKYITPAVKNILEFAFRIEDEKQGYKPEFPNCIAINDPSDKFADDFIQMAKETADVNFVELQGETPLERLENAEKSLEEAQALFKNTGKRTLLYFKDMEFLVRNDVNLALLDCMKEFTNTGVEDYHTTIIFKTREMGKIHHEVNCPHRIGMCCELDDGSYKFEYTKEQIDKMLNPQMIPAEKALVNNTEETSKTVETVKQEVVENKNTAVEVAEQKPETVKGTAKMLAEEAKVEEKPATGKAEAAKEAAKETVKETAKATVDEIKEEIKKDGQKITQKIEKNFVSLASVRIKPLKVVKILGSIVAVGVGVGGCWISKDEAVRNNVVNIINDIKKDWKDLFNANTTNDNNIISVKK